MPGSIDDIAGASKGMIPSTQHVPQQKYHWDFLVKEMKWMAEDFERETKKKVGDSKKQVRACRK